MSTGPNRILDEFAKLMTDAAGAAQGVRREVETAFKGQAERILNTMDVVQREEFEAAREMARRSLPNWPVTPHRRRRPSPAQKNNR